MKEGPCRNLKDSFLHIYNNLNSCLFFAAKMKLITRKLLHTDAENNFKLNTRKKTKNKHIHIPSNICMYEYTT